MDEGHAEQYPRVLRNEVDEGHAVPSLVITSVFILRRVKPFNPPTQFIDSDAFDRKRGKKKCTGQYEMRRAERMLLDAVSAPVGSIPPAVAASSHGQWTGRRNEVTDVRFLPTIKPRRAWVRSSHICGAVSSSAAPG